MCDAVTGVLAERRVLITGASRGVGFEISKRFISEGAHVIGVARNQERLQHAAARLQLQPPGRFEPLTADLTEVGCEHRLVEAVTKRWGALDILVNNAAVMLKAPGTGGFDLEAAGVLQATLNANLLSPFRITLALLPLLEKGREPRVVHVTSGAGTLQGLSEPGLSSYRLSKWALNGMMKIMATQWRGRVAVNAIDPGWVKTDMGGAAAPGSPVESAQAALSLVELPWVETGQLYKNGRQIDL